MLIGVPKEIKSNENRVGLVPGSVRELVQHGHRVLVERGAGAAIGFSDEAYGAVGAELVATAADVFARAEMIVKVKEPQPSECAMLREGQILFTYLHLAADKAQAEALIRSQAVCIAYETVTDVRHGLPLLAPMSEVAGRMSIQVAAHCLETQQGGGGMLLGGVPGVPAAKVVILGGGVSGTNAARMAMGMEAHVTVIDRSLQRLNELDMQFGARLHTLFSTAENIERTVIDADAVIGAVLIPGAAAPKLVSRDMVRQMKQGAVMVDIAIDQGGCFETSRPTSHDKPTFIEHGVVHYCVTNMPGAVARTSTVALNNATLPFVISLADRGWKRALRHDPHLKDGLNIAFGRVTHEAVAHALGYHYLVPDEVLAD
ncbi:alanine dehydrogenase [Aliidongia dinghuensis]|uniref:Alanine dehydrogenase n=1 Tax=Aliidongia dinghuensis TaxID=1867774 RepID=A0A8J2YXX6_9PROT|nr:alanine dehydrogenase [Aliidongia dinghuensis]GGF30388.1 alanine dehydrogenase [Aliidongia dinghuensis]